MTGLLVLLCLLPSILGSTIRASSYDASNYLSDFEVYKESYAIPSAMDPSIKNYRQLIFVRNMQKI